MPIGIANVTEVSMDNLTSFTNVTDLPTFAAKVNHDIFSGWLYFIALFVLMIIIYFKLNDVEDQPLINIMYSSGIITIISLFIRAIEITYEGVPMGLISDYQMWIFPLITILSAGIIWATKPR